MRKKKSFMRKTKSKTQSWLFNKEGGSQPMNRAARRAADKKEGGKHPMRIAPKHGP